MKPYYVLTGHSREYFNDYADALIFARYMNGVLKRTEDDETIQDFYNEEFED